MLHCRDETARLQLTDLEGQGRATTQGQHHEALTGAFAERVVTVDLGSGEWLWFELGENRPMYPLWGAGSCRVHTHDVTTVRRDIMGNAPDKQQHQNQQQSRPPRPSISPRSSTAQHSTRRQGLPAVRCVAHPVRRCVATELTQSHPGRGRVCPCFVLMSCLPAALNAGACATCLRMVPGVGWLTAASGHISPHISRETPPLDKISKDSYRQEKRETHFPHPSLSATAQPAHHPNLCGAC